MLPTVRHTKYGRIRGMVVGEGGRSSGVLLYRIDSNDIVTGSSAVFKRIARHIYFAGLDVELFERAEVLSEIFYGKEIAIKPAILSSWVL